MRVRGLRSIAVDALQETRHRRKVSLRIHITSVQCGSIASTLIDALTVASVKARTAPQKRRPGNNVRGDDDAAGTTDEVVGDSGWCTLVVRLASARRIVRPGGKILAANPLLVKEHE
jgi:hypothetical protein